MLVTIPIRCGNLERDTTFDVVFDGDDYVTLSQDAIDIAELMAKKRRAAAAENNRKHRYKYKEEFPGQADYYGRQGCFTELAVALLTRQKWAAFLHDLKDNPPDVGNDIQVRGADFNTDKPNSLLLHKTDKDQERWVLAYWSGTYPKYIWAPGWLYGHEAKNEKYWKEPQKGRWCFKVPKNDCRKFGTLSEVQALQLPDPPVVIPTHDEHCYGCYEVSPGISLHAPRNGGPLKTLRSV